jgi:ankyrin repeat protein
MATRFDFCNILERINGSPRELKYIVENREKDFYTNDVRQNMTPLILATLFCGFSTFTYVFNSNPSSINNFDSGKGTAIVYAIIYGFRDKFDFLFKKGADLTMRCDYDKKNSLMVATDQRDIYFLQKILKLKIFDIDEETILGYNTLMFAVSNGNREAIKLILFHGANVNYIPKKWKTMNIIKCALDHKSYLKCDDLLSLLIENGAHTINSLISYSGNKTTKCGFNNVQLLLQAGASPNQSNKHGITPLMNAVKKGNFEIVKLLVKHDANIQAKPRRGDSVLELARKSKSPQISDYLTKEDNWRRRRNFVLFLRCLFTYSRESLSSMSKISSIDKIFVLDKSNYMLHIIMSYI